MKILRLIIKWTGWYILFILSITICFIGIFVSYNYYHYYTSSLPKARAEAQEEFANYCKEQGLDPNSFQGPGVDEFKNPPSYFFTWRRPPDEEIFVNVNYFYYGTSPSMNEMLHDSFLYVDTRKQKTQGAKP